MALIQTGRFGLRQDGPRPRPCGVTDNARSLAAVTELAAWAADPACLFRQDAVDEFLGSADLRLIAHAMATGATREQPAPHSKKKMKMPDACNAFGVTWTDPFSLYRTLGMRLVA
ncbi:MAG TPA: DUF4411 family protein [Nocardioidaceae bacterium]|nr:DUF4411 family protein [Nocardioidaceae bacterium]